MNDQNLNQPENPEDFWAEAEGLGRALLDCLDYFEALGVDQLPSRLAPPPPARPAVVPAAQPTTAGRSAPARPPAERPGMGRPAAEPLSARPAAENGDPGLWAPAASGLADLDRLIENCRACPLAQTRPEDPVPGRGSAGPLLLVVGPTPAMFEGPQGELLTAMIEKGLKLSAADYYVTSLVKCRPAAESPDLDRADAICRPFLMRQLDLLAPKIVLALGKKPGQRLSGLEGEPLGLLRPRSHKVAGQENIWLRISYGLEDILGSQKLKEAAWQDLLRVRPGLQKLKDS